MSMPADHDDTIDDGVLKQVIAELRRPVRLDPAVDQQVLDLIRSESPAAAAPGTPRRWGAWLAGAAIAAGVLLSVVLPDRRPATDPASAVAVERTEASGDARPVRLRLAAPTSSRVVVVG